MTRITRSRPVRRLRPPTNEVWMYIKDPDRLRRRRKTKGFTQTQLAVHARCTQQYISKLESGLDRDCGEDIAIRVSKALDIELEDYFETRADVRMPHVATASRGSRNPATVHAGVRVVRPAGARR
ncbi:helix-turn-helix transcriptional regulator [Nocardioides bruguierae]|uniref:helix-turn-helix transcriptional regulator n=1 Tax=Nocardioides bruguierae TaxID=2945102 RepID=UPI002020CAE0|nr:helix-turn-helix transcriptional regulator [Nocardioides bruguierae]MCL8026351.1 helix-turn-helix transcriptional regulator [Nocardioides bruguierae]